MGLSASGPAALAKEQGFLLAHLCGIAGWGDTSTLLGERPPAARSIAGR